MVRASTRARSLIKILLEEHPTPLKRKEIAKRMNLSESSIRELMRQMVTLEINHGFQIQLLKGQGYFIEITKAPLFNEFMDRTLIKAPIDYHPKQRLEILLFYLLQGNGYQTVNQLEEKLALSRSTILKELKLVEKELLQFKLKLERKAHYGLLITGSEQDYRKAFSKYVLSSTYYLEPIREYKNFIENFNSKELRAVLAGGIAKNKVQMSDVAFKNILMHLKILIFRTKQKNFITNEAFPIEGIAKAYVAVATHVMTWIESQYKLTFPKSEIQFLALHLSAKTMVTTINSREKKKLTGELKWILERLDQEFLTNFQKDLELQEALLLHLLSLLKRLYFNLQLENPLVEEIYTKYRNIFIVSYRFAEFIEKKYKLTLSRDEVGYLALHFATLFERYRNQQLKKIKRIVVICTTGGGSAHLLRLKLENTFSQALIITTASHHLADFDAQLPDVFLSTIPMPSGYKNVPMIHIKEFLDEEEIRRIKDHVYLQISEFEAVHPILPLKVIFSESFFQRSPPGHYLDIIKAQSEKMVEEGLTVRDFFKQVMEREEKFSTVYENGIAGPHSIHLNAHQDSVGVTILEDPIKWQGKEVRLIFLINLKRGHLFLHKEISRLLLYLMDHSVACEKLLRSVSFEQFIKELEKLM